MTILLSVDPSIRSPGAALFVDCVLVAAADFDVETHPDPMVRCRDVGTQIHHWASQRGTVHDLIVEWPQTDERTRRIDPADLFGLAGVCGALVWSAQSVSSVTPSTWTGGVPKARSGDPARSPRGALVSTSLAPAELALLAGLRHDAWDAVGIGLWKLRRLRTPGRAATRPDAPGLASKRRRQ